MSIKAPWPYFGGKADIAPLIWRRLGNTPNFVEAFFGSGAVLLSRPAAHFVGDVPRTETVNDIDGLLTNAWRALQQAPEETARHADWPVSEICLHARHAVLVEARATLQTRMEAEPEWFDAKLAGWWIWGACCWIGSGWCSGGGPWHRVETEDGLRLVNRNGSAPPTAEGNAGQGINRKLPHLGDGGQGINRKLPHLGDGGRGIAEYFALLSARLRRVRIACGDWTRVLGPSVTFRHGLTGVFLDPPYSHAERKSDLYAHDNDVAAAVRAWCLENGANPLLRIALCDYGESEMLSGWERVTWKARGGYGSQGNGAGRENSERETIWFSPHCLKPELTLFNLGHPHRSDDAEFDE